MISPMPTANVPGIPESLSRTATVKSLAVDDLKARTVSELQFIRSPLVEFTE